MPERLIILGGGFAGIRAARLLSGSKFEITLVDQQNYHLFAPLLYQVAVGDLESTAIATPMRRVLRDTGLRFHWGQVTHIDWIERRLHCGDGSTLMWDRLLLAFGSVTNFFGSIQIAEGAQQLKGLDAAEQTRSAVLAAVERASHSDDPLERKRLLTFVIAGGGATGVEFCGALLELLKILLLRDYPELGAVRPRVVMVQGAKALLPGFAPALQAYAAKSLSNLGAEICYGSHVSGFDAQGTHLDSGAVIPSGVLIWTAGVRPHPLAEQIPGEKTRVGRIVVDAHLRLPHDARVSVLGDLAYGETAGVPWPQVAPFAIQSASHAVRCLSAEAAGRALPAPFQYRDPGGMAVLGRFDGICQIPRYHVQATGFSAWALWAGVHLYGIVGTKNRLLTLLDWSRDYFRHGAAVPRIRAQ